MIYTATKWMVGASTVGVEGVGAFGVYLHGQYAQDNNEI